MNRLDPKVLFERLASDIPGSLRKHLFVTGSLAAAYHFRDLLVDRAVSTKDADLIVHPAGDVESCRQIAEQLLRLGWHRTSACRAQPTAEPRDELAAIRLYPPQSQEYFVEFLNVPEIDEINAKQWLPVRLDDGWYGLPSFRFLRVASVDRATSHVGLEYARPSMMAAANLLSHPALGATRIQSGAMRGKLRSAKDLGRVLALARLTGREGTESWLAEWRDAIRQCFPQDYESLLRTLGRGLEELLGDQNALEEARVTTDIGLLNGMQVSAAMLQATGRRLLQDVILPLRGE